MALTAWQALFDEGRLEAGQRVLINGAGGVVGKYAIQLAVRAGVHVVATASPRSADAVRAAGAQQVIDHTTTDVLAAVDEPVDVLLNLAPIEPEQFRALVAAVRDGGVVVSTTAFMATPDDESRGVRAATVFVLPDRGRLAELVALVDAGQLTVEVTRRIRLEDLPALHAEGAAGRIAARSSSPSEGGRPPAGQPMKDAASTACSPVTYGVRSTTRSSRRKTYRPTCSTTALRPSQSAASERSSGRSQSTGSDVDRNPRTAAVSCSARRSSGPSRFRALRK